MKNLKLYEEFDNIVSDKVVIRHIEDITPDESDLPDYFIEHNIKGRKFKRVDYDLDDLLKTDQDFKEYYDSGEERYDQDEMDSNTLYNEIVIVDGELLDGYSRASTLLRMGKNTANAYVAI